MTDFRRPSPAPIPPDGLARVVRGGRRRRARLTASGGAVAAGLALVVAVAGGPGANQSLRPADDPSHASASATPSAPEPSYDPSASPEPGAPGSPKPSYDPSPDPGEEPSTAPAEFGSPAPSPTDPVEPDEPRGPRYAHHQRTRTGTGVSGAPGASTSTEMDIWVVDAGVTRKAVNAPGRPATTYDLKVSICARFVQPRTDEQRLDFATTQEADFDVVDAQGRVVWHWSDGQSFADHRHSRGARAGQCLWWATEWDGVGHDGTLVAPGTYTVRLYITADGWDGWADEEVEVSSRHR